MPTGLDSQGWPVNAKANVVSRKPGRVLISFVCSCREAGNLRESRFTNKSQNSYFNQNLVRRNKWAVWLHLTIKYHLSLCSNIWYELIEMFRLKWWVVCVVAYLVAETKKKSFNMTKSISSGWTIFQFYSDTTNFFFVALFKTHIFVNKF